MNVLRRAFEIIDFKKKYKNIFLKSNKKLPTHTQTIEPCQEEATHHLPLLF
jgi:hypothetical protein